MESSGEQVKPFPASCIDIVFLRIKNSPGVTLAHKEDCRFIDDLVTHVVKSWSVRSGVRSPLNIVEFAATITG